MSKQALGLIETLGLLAAVEAADTAVKSANVELIGYEFARGDGMTTVKIAGDVGAVKAAVDSAGSAVSKIGTLCSVQVIARPAPDLEKIVYSAETAGIAAHSSKGAVKEAAEEENGAEISANIAKEPDKEVQTEVLAREIAAMREAKENNKRTRKRAAREPD